MPRCPRFAVRLADSRSSSAQTVGRSQAVTDAMFTPHSRNSQKDVPGLAGCFVDHDQVAAVVAAVLPVRVQKLDAADRAAGRKVHVARIAELVRPDLSRFLLEAEAADVVARVAGQFHRIKSI